MRTWRSIFVTRLFCTNNHCSFRFKQAIDFGFLKNMSTSSDGRASGGNLDHGFSRRLKYGGIGQPRPEYTLAMDEIIRSEIVGTAGLTVTACVALFLSWCRTPKVRSRTDLQRTENLLLLGLVLQSAHFIEEYATGFYDLFPPILRLLPWPRSFFVTFNLFWLGIWVWAASRLRTSSRLAFWATWFFSAAALADGMAHPLLAVRVGGYFPGLLTAPLVGMAGVWLLVRLFAATEPRRTGVTGRSMLL